MEGDVNVASDHALYQRVGGKTRLKKFLADGVEVAPHREHPLDGSDLAFRTKPIADLFPEVRAGNEIHESRCQSSPCSRRQPSCSPILSDSPPGAQYENHVRCSLSWRQSISTSTKSRRSDVCSKLRRLEVGTNQCRMSGCFHPHEVIHNKIATWPYVDFPNPGRTTL